MKQKKLQWLVTMAFAVVILVLSAVGGSWKVGLADTIPTIPVVESIDYPKPVYVNQAALEITITGNNFIDITYTKVRWEGPDATILLLTPASLSADKTTLKVLVPPTALLKSGTAKVTVINHPEAGMVEVSQNYNVLIMEKLFLTFIKSQSR